MEDAEIKIFLDENDSLVCNITDYVLEFLNNGEASFIYEDGLVLSTESPIHEVIAKKLQKNPSDIKMGIASILRVLINTIKSGDEFNNTASKYILEKFYTPELIEYYLMHYEQICPIIEDMRVTNIKKGCVNQINSKILTIVTTDENGDKVTLKLECSETKLGSILKTLSKK